MFGKYARQEATKPLCGLNISVGTQRVNSETATNSHAIKNDLTFCCCPATCFRTIWWEYAWKCKTELKAGVHRVHHIVPIRTDGMLAPLTTPTLSPYLSLMRSPCWHISSADNLTGNWQVITVVLWPYFSKCPSGFGPDVSIVNTNHRRWFE